MSKKNRQGGDASETKSTGPKAAQADPSERVRQATNKMTAFEKYFPFSKSNLRLPV